MRRSVADLRTREDGMTLIEVMIAGFVLSVAVLGVASVAGTSLVSVRDSRERDRATAAASSALEAVRAMNFDDIAVLSNGGWETDPLITASGSGYLFDHDGDGTATEPVWASPSAPIHPYECTAASACWFDMPDSDRVSVRTFVTWVDPAAQNEKLITTVAVWDDPSFDSPRQVRMSTVISVASRGLPVPAFEVVPQVFNQLPVDPGVVERRQANCFNHTLENLGAPDSYDLVMPADWSARQPRTDGTWQNEKWVSQVWMAPTGQPFDSTTLMLASSVESDFHVDSQHNYATNETANVRVCYTPRPVDSADGGTTPVRGETFSFDLTFRSKFDPGITKVVRHPMRISDTPFDLYLHDSPGFMGSHDRAVRTTAAGTALFEEFPMNTVHPSQMAPPDGPRDFTLPDYDQDIDPILRRGLWLPKDQLLTTPLRVASDYAAVWQYSFQSPRVFKDSADVHLWISWRNSDEVNPKDIKINLRGQLWLHRSARDKNPTLVGETDLKYTHKGQGWKATFNADLLNYFRIPLSGGELSLQNGNVLRLKVWNISPEVDPNGEYPNAHIAYDVTSHPSRLVFYP